MVAPQPRRTQRLPPAVRENLRQAQRVEWFTLVLRLSAVALLYLALGSTQALNAIWLKSVWALFPPLAFLAACRIERFEPTPRFPYGFYRVGSIAFLSAALALACMGLYLLYGGLRGLFEARHPQLEPFWDHAQLTAWHGWPMIGALLYSIAVPFIAGRSRQQLAVDIHDKGLYADATMGRVSWLAGSAAVIGLLGVGLGLWWADFIATLFIGGDILWHGYRHLHTAVCDLIDEVPRGIGSDRVDPLGTTIRDRLESLDWVACARVRLREEGRMLTGIALICPHPPSAPDTSARPVDLLARFEAARAEIERLDWRLLDFQLVPVRRTTLDRLCDAAIDARVERSADNG